MPETPKYHLRYPSTTERPSASQISALADDVEEALDGKWGVESNWQDLALGNLWVPFGDGFDTPGYRLSGGGVEFRGVMKSGGLGAVLNTRLPAGYRPSAAKMFFPGAGAGHARLHLDTTGQLSVEAWVGAGDNGFVSLDQIRYSTPS